MKPRLMTVLLAAFGLVVLLSGSSLFAQISIPSANGSVDIKVARPARVDAHNEPLHFGWIVPNGTKTIPSWDPRALRFMISGEGSATLDVTFPLSITLLRDGIYSGAGNEVYFARAPVKSMAGYPPVQPGSGAPDFVGAGVTTGTATFPGPPGLSPGGFDPRVYFWLGGTLTAPAGTTQGFYYFAYTVTISNYSM